MDLKTREANQKVGTALMKASFWGYFEIVQLLLDRGADVNLADIDGDTALMDAAMQGHLGIVRLLLDHGANPTVSDTRVQKASDLASENGHRDVVEMLQKKIIALNSRQDAL